MKNSVIVLTVLVLSVFSAWLTYRFLDRGTTESAAVKQCNEVRLLIPDLSVFVAQATGELMTSPVDSGFGPHWRNYFSANAIKELKVSQLMSKQCPTEEQIQAGADDARISCEIYGVEVVHAEYPHTARVIITGRRIIENSSKAFDQASCVPDFFKKAKHGRAADFTLDVRVANLPDVHAFKITHVRFTPERQPLYRF